MILFVGCSYTWGSGLQYEYLYDKGWSVDEINKVLPVNYHLEHHLLSSVPKYRLASFHLALKEKGLLDNAEIESGYLAFIKRLIIHPQSA